jgi:serine/threonine-protein kinase
VVSQSSVPKDDESTESTEFLQDRVARYGLFGSFIVLGFLSFRAVMIALDERLSLLVHPSFTLHLGAGVALVVLFLSCRTGTRSARAVRTLETTCLLVCGTCLIAMGIYIPPFVRPDLIVVAALNASLVSRAIYVPSSARRTGMLGGAFGVPLAIAVYGIYSKVDPATLVGLDPGMQNVTSHRLALRMVVDSGAWWVCTVVVSVAASRVIYGLRREVQQVRRLGQYQLESRLGAGGMGIVYRARHAMLRRPTAVKLLPKESAGEASVRRFELEVRQTARLSHPNTVTIFDYGRTPAGVFYYAMELLDGLTLDAIVHTDGPQPAARVLHVLGQAAGALSEAHEAGLIHRDIKPANVMLCRAGGLFDVTKVLDFGLVKEIARTDTTALTKADSLTGTPQYMAPESITAPDSIDHRVDLYALGALGYYLVTGEHVFEGRALLEICSQHLHAAPIPASERLGAPVAADLEALIMNLLEKDRERRPATARDVLRRLEACADFGKWTQTRAEEWWTARGDAAVRSASLPVSETIDIALEGRHLLGQ